MVKFNKKLTTKHFVISHMLVLIAGFSFLAGLYYILNIQYQKPNDPFLNGPVTTPPKSLRLSLDQPDNDSLIFQSSVIISGKTAPLADVLISTDTFDIVIKSKPDGSFTTVLNLNEGINRITVVVFDSTGDSRMAERTVYFSKEKL